MKNDLAVNAQGGVRVLYTGALRFVTVKPNCRTQKKSLGRSGGKSNNIIEAFFDIPPEPRYGTPEVCPKGPLGAIIFFLDFLNFFCLPCWHLNWMKNTNPPPFSFVLTFKCIRAHQIFNRFVPFLLPAGCTELIILYTFVSKRRFFTNVKKKFKKKWRWPSRKMKIWYKYNNNVVFIFA